MSTTLTLQAFPGGTVWLATATSTLSDPMYYWWRDGQLVTVTKCNVMTFSAVGDSQISVFDSAEDTPDTEAFPWQDTIQWEHADSAQWYEIEEYIEGVWTPRAVIRDIGQWVFTWQTRALEDCALHTFRYRPCGDRVLGEYKTFSAYMIRNPDHPNATPSVSETGVLTFA